MNRAIPTSLAMTLIVALSLSAGDARARGQKARKPDLGYRCVLEERRGAFGIVSGYLEQRIGGSQFNGLVRWDSADGQYRSPWVTAAFFRPPGKSFSLDEGHVAVMSHIWARKPGKRPGTLTLTLEMGTTLSSSGASSRLSSAPQRSGGPFHLQVGWSDAAALAKGSDHLYIIGRDKRLAIVAHDEIDRTMFDCAEPHIRSAFERLEAMIVDPGKNCGGMIDLGSDDIIVT